MPPAWDRFQRGIQLALLANGVEDRLAPLLELAQIGQALFQSAQLRIVEGAGQLLAVAGDERDRCAAVEQRYRRLHLLVAYAKFLRNFLIDVCHAEFPLPKATELPGDALMDHAAVIHQGAE